jgi:hypothetical protein
MTGLLMEVELPPVKPASERAGRRSVKLIKIEATCESEAEKQTGSHVIIYFYSESCEKSELLLDGGTFMFGCKVQVPPSIESSDGEWGSSVRNESRLEETGKVSSTAAFWLASREKRTESSETS